MSLIKLIILKSLIHLNGERSIYSIYHLLTGKRSSQTIQDASLYQLKEYFGIFPQLERSEIETITNQLVHFGYAINNQNVLIATPKGKEVVQHSSSPSFNGWRYSSITPLFWDRLSLCIQSLSHLIHFQNRFIPINTNPDILQWVKWFLKNHSLPREELAQSLYDEVYCILDKLNDLKAQIFVLKLTGKDRIGFTNEQIGTITSKTEADVQLLFVSTIHFILSEIESTKSQYPILSKITRLNHDTLTLTQSTQNTYKLLKSGRSIDEIAKERVLKRNTIEDHIVEITWQNPDFEISAFINESKYEMIKDTIQSIKSNQLKVIKDAVTAEVNYFEIRLVLAKVGGAFESSKTIN